MSVNGFDDSKNKKEVYTKEEVYTKDDFAVLKFKASKDKWKEGGETSSLYYSLLYPVGFTMDNCVIISCIIQDEMLALAPYYGTNGAEGYECTACLCPENILVNVETSGTPEWCGDVSGKVTLMKYDVEKSEYSYNLGDVNGDGEVGLGDLAIINAYLAGETTLTTQQERAADLNRDGVIDEADANTLQEYLTSLE